MRVRCKRFPPIEKDMKMILAHCGSLFLDPRSLAEARLGPSSSHLCASSSSRCRRRCPSYWRRLLLLVASSPPACSPAAVVAMNMKGVAWWVVPFVVDLRCCGNGNVRVAQVYHELVVLEHLHTRAEVSVGASVEAISKPLLELF